MLTAPQMPLILRAIITGFGYKLGSELGRWVVDRFKRKRKADEPEDTQDDLPEGLPKDPANPGVDKTPPVVSPAERTN